jgi:lipopolysaccharide export system ATP-binding protein
MLATAAVIVTVAGASAADLPSKKAAPATFVKICDTYGAGYFFIPGSDTCLKIGGRVRYDLTYVPTGKIFNSAGAKDFSVQDTYGQHVRGRITLDGTDITHQPMHARARLGLGYLPQEASIFRRMTVAENIRAILEIGHDDDDFITRRTDELLEELHVSHLHDAAAVSLSGGERRRVEIARALATDPRFVLLDEPFAGVDPIAVIDIQTIIAYLRDRGIGVLITDHNVRETLGICDHAFIISQGHVLASGEPAAIVDNEDVRRVYLGERFRL